MNLKKTIAIFLLSFGSLYPMDSIKRVWFSKRIIFRNGFEFIQLTLQEKKFYLIKLSFNEDRKWEETRMQGVMKENEKGTFFLKPEMCTLFATRKLGQRWILIQGFDCDHFEIQITKNEQEILISPSIGITETLKLKQENHKLKNAVGAIIVSEEEKKFHAWGIGMRTIRKGSTAFLNGKPIVILETVDSTGTFETNEPFQIGDWIVIQNRSQSDIFD